MDSTDAPAGPQAASRQGPLRYGIWLFLLASALWIWLGEVPGFLQTVFVISYWVFAGMIWLAIAIRAWALFSSRAAHRLHAAAEATARESGLGRLVRYALLVAFAGLLWETGMPILAAVYVAAVLANLGLRVSLPAARSAA